jgi:hypothetical protein
MSTTPTTRTRGTRRTRRTHTVATVLAGLLGVTVLALIPAPAQASRIPADPMAFVPTPTALSQLVTDGHASSVRSALQDLWADRAGR